MPSIRQQLPPLDALVMFDAAARHLSFTLAAKELNVTQAAVSRQIRILEENLGVLLFVRSHRSVELTPEGRSFQHSAHTALIQICDATNEIRDLPQTSLAIATDQAVAGLWLTPRMSEFFAANPDISIRLIVSDNQSDCLRERVDVAIVHGDGQWPGFTARMLFPERIVPVCSPECLEKYGPADTIRSLLDFPLIEHEDDRWDWMNWRVWLTMNSVDTPPTCQKLLVNNYALAIESAINGNGVALGWRYLVDDALNSGKLVRPVAESVSTKLGYHLVTADTGHQSEATELFVAWVERCAGASACRID